MNIDKDDITALFGTIIIHLVLLILLYFGVMRTYVPLDDGGIPVNFGDIYVSTGTYEPPPATVPPQQQTPPRTTTAAAPKTEVKTITQNKVETVAVPEPKKETPVVDEKAQKEKEEAERRRKEEEERRRREEELRKQQEAISNRVSNAFGSGSSQDNSQGDASAGTSNQGSPFGNSDSGPNVGTGGFGTFNLNGRSIGAGGLPRPADNEREEGRIVINITVDPAGNVIQTDIGRGTNIDNPVMRRSALEAAKRAKFNKIQGTNNQSGTITYNYKLN